MSVRISAESDIFFAELGALEWVRRVVALLPRDSEAAMRGIVEWEIDVVDGDRIVIKRQLNLIDQIDGTKGEPEKIMVWIEGVEDNTSYVVFPQTGRQGDNVPTMLKSPEETVKPVLDFLKRRATDLFLELENRGNELRDVWGVAAPEIIAPKSR